MAPPREPCYCDRCKGSYVSRKTVLRHAAKSRPAIPTFDEWMGTGQDRREETEVLGSSSMSVKMEKDSADEMEEAYSAKRQRTDALYNRDKDTVAQNERDIEMLEERYREPEHNIPEKIDQDPQNDGHVPNIDPHIRGQHSDDEVDDEDDADGDPGYLQDEHRNAAEAEAARARLQLERSPTPDDVGIDDEDVPAGPFSRIEHVRFAQEFIREISQATYYNGNLDEATIDRLENPLQDLVDISDPDIRLSLDLYIACGNASEETYNNVRRSVLTRFPEAEVLSYHMVKKFIAETTGIYAISDDMCINSCHAFTGPFKDLENCRLCNEPRFDPIEFARSGKQIPRQQATTIPLGPQIQALRRSKKGAEAMRYRDKKTTEIIEAFNAAETPDEIVYDIRKLRMVREGNSWDSIA